MQVHEEGNSILRPRTSGAIALWPMGNEQEGYYFLSLHSGKRLNRYSWTELPMPSEVIAQVHRLAVAAKKYDGIVLTNLDSRKLPDQFDDDKHQDDATDSMEGQDDSNTSDTNDGNINNTNDDVENEDSTGIPQEA